ncbi:MAG: hypothetical protein Q4E33_00845 [Erysipelotrichaceae bacterium]|nr:hypothetical protein [Erysipelotrichaceae bacterium]
MNELTVQVNEAILVGEKTLTIIDNILENLQSAKNWGIFDMLSNGSLFSSIFKHSKLDSAQNKMEELKYMLNNFNKELNDVIVYCNVSYVNFDEFTKFVDILFDNFFIDIYAFSRISDSKKQIEQLRKDVIDVLNKLKNIK